MFLTTNPTELGSKYGSRSATLPQMKNNILCRLKKALRNHLKFHNEVFFLPAARFFPPPIHLFLYSFWSPYFIPIWCWILCYQRLIVLNAWLLFYLLGLLLFHIETLIKRVLHLNRHTRYKRLLLCHFLLIFHQYFLFTPLLLHFRNNNLTMPAKIFGVNNALMKV